MHKSSGTDDKKLQASLKKLNVQPIQAIEEVNMFKEDGNVIHFANPKGMNIPLIPYTQPSPFLLLSTFLSVTPRILTTDCSLVY